MAGSMTKRLHEMFAFLLLLWVAILLCAIDAFTYMPISRVANNGFLSTQGMTLFQSQNYVETDEYQSDKGDGMELLDGVPKVKKKRSLEKSNFWNVVPETLELDENDVMPCRHHLDSDGPLPFGSYRLLGKPDFEPKRTCLTTIAIDVTRNAAHPFSGNIDFSEIDCDKAVMHMQSLIDSGFTSFQVAHPMSPYGTIRSKKGPADPDWFESSSQEIWSESNIYGHLMKDTPSFVTSSCHFSTNINLPPKNYEGPFGNGSFLRDIVGQKIERMGVGDSIDTVQLCYHEDSPYCLDVIDALFEMQREGLISSISGKNLPRKLLDEASACGYELDSNQVTCNLLDPNKYVNHIGTSGNSQSKVLVSSPLAGGFLTENMLQNKFCCAPPYLMSKQQNWHIENSLRQWAGRHYEAKPKELRHGKFWEYFYSHFISTLQGIAYKHEVTVSSVALRWAMQLDHLGSVVVASGLQARGDDDRPYERPHNLREIYSFHLDDEDMEKLWQISGKLEPKIEEFEGFDDDYGNRFIPDFSNTKLWL